MGSLERLSLYCDWDLRKRLVYTTSDSKPSYCLLFRKVKKQKPNNLTLFRSTHVAAKVRLIFSGFEPIIYGFVVSASFVTFKYSWIGE